MKYDGKTVRFLAQAYVGKDVPAGSFVPGRFGMVCCADDVTFLGFLCRYPDRDQLHNRDWVKVTASITVEELPQYRGPRSGAACYHGRTRRKGEGRYRLL